MSQSNYIEVKVTKKAAKTGKIIILSGLVIGILIMIVSGIFFASGQTDIANILIIVGFGVIFLGILIYMFIAFISNLRLTMSKKTLNKTALRIILMVSGSLLLLVILVVLLSL